MSIEKLRGLMATSNACEQQLRLTIAALNLHRPSPMDERLAASWQDILADAASSPVKDATSHLEAEDD